MTEQVILDQADLEPARTTGSLTENRLEQFGYKQELKRNYSLFSLIAFGIVTLTPPSAISNTLGSPLVSGGPVTLVWGYIIVSIFTVFVALSMAEISAVYPLAGGPCSWAYQLASKRYRVIASWYTGYFNIFSQIAFAASAFFQGIFMVIGCITLGQPSYTPESYHYVLLSIGVILISLVTNVFCNSWQAKSMPPLFVMNVTTCLAAVITLLVMTRGEHRQSAKFIFTKYINETGFHSKGYVFILGMLQSAYTFTGYDSVTHLSEEMDNPSTGVPRALMVVVGTGILYGFFFLISLCASLFDIEDLLSSPTGAPYIQLIKNATGSTPAAIIFGLTPALAAIIAGNTMTLANSRTIYSFARDGAFIFPSYFSKVNSKFDVPIPAIFFSCAIQCIIVVLYLSSDVVYNTIISITTIGHEITYAIPILCCILYGRKNKLSIHSKRPWNLGPMGGPIVNAISLVWLTFISITMFFPTLNPVTTSTMNYTCAIIAIVLAYATILWFVQGRKTFKGPEEALEMSGEDQEERQDGLQVLEAAERVESLESPVNEKR